MSNSNEENNGSVVRYQPHPQLSLINTIPNFAEENNVSVRFLKSSTGKVFQLQWENISAFAPGLARLTKDTLPPMVTTLSESESVLKVVFAFMKRERHPTLEDCTNIESLIAVADTIFKYEVFSGINTCIARLRSLTPDYPLFVFSFAAAHDHTELLNESAIYLCSPDYTFDSLVEKVPAELLLPLIRYQKAWGEKFQSILMSIRKLPTCTEKECHDDNKKAGPEVPKKICSACKSGLFGWISKMDEISHIGVLKESLRRASINEMATPRYAFISPIPASVVRMTTMIAEDCLDTIDYGMRHFDYFRSETAALLESDD